MYRNGNYTAFYVKEPFNATNLGANIAHDFVYYNMLRAWKEKDSSFPFIDSHDKTYNVRDDSDWEQTLKPRLHERLNKSKNIILFLSSITKHSRALNEELDFGMRHLSLPVIVIYPDLTDNRDIYLTSPAGIKSPTYKISRLWDSLPVFKQYKNQVSILHIPMDRNLITRALNDLRFADDSNNYGQCFY